VKYYKIQKVKKVIENREKLLREIYKGIRDSTEENKYLKADMANKDKAPIIVNNNTTNTQGKASAPTSSPADDRPAYMKKAQGQ
jgi:hypothetical protein